MKRKFNQILFLIAASVLNCITLNAQDDEGTKLDLLKAPASPASSLLKFATTDIEKPTDLSSLMLSLQSNTSSFTKLPGNYAVDIVPYWLFRTKTDFTTTGLNSTKSKDVFRQTFVLSFGIKNVDSAVQEFKSTSTYGAVGFKFSLIRPEYTSATKTLLGEIHALQSRLNSVVFKQVQLKNKEYLELEIKYQEMLEAIKTQFPGDPTSAAIELARRQGISSDEIYINEKRRAELNQQSIDAVLKNQEKLTEELVAKAKEFDNKREGLSWDIAGGVSSEFRNKKFDNSKVHNAGLWTTVGFNKKTFSFLFLGRYLINPGREYEDKNQQLQSADISTLDGGIRILYSTVKSKFNASVEGLYRQSFTSMKNETTWRMIFNADYSIWQNQKLTFSFGRDFDGTITRDGNLVAALSFLTGFGNKR